MNGELSMIGVGRKSYFRDLLLWGAAITSAGFIAYGFITAYKREAKDKLAHEIFYQLDANRDKVLDPQESAPLAEKGLLPKGISLDQLTRKLQEIQQETLQSFLEERQPKK